jgi:hypothetical protein
MIGTIYAALGEKDKAFEFLEKAYNEKSPDVAYFLKADLRIDSLRTDPRFQNLLQRMASQSRSELSVVGKILLVGGADWIRPTNLSLRPDDSIGFSLLNLLKTATGSLVLDRN